MKKTGFFFVFFIAPVFSIPLITHRFDREPLIAQIRYAKSLIEKLEYCFSNNSYCSLEQSINELIRLLSPRECRIFNMKQRLIQAELETKAYVAIKCNNIQPLISFIVPVYNRQETIRESLDSIVHFNWSIPVEIIVVDDGSTDTTHKVLEEYENKYKNVFVYTHTKNIGAPSARNTAILHARGTYIFNLDSDDILKPEAVIYMLEALQKSNLEHAYFDEYNFFWDSDIKNIVLNVKIKHPTAIYTVFDAAICQYSVQLPLVIGCRLFSKRAWSRVGGFIENLGHDNWAFGYMLCAAGMPALITSGCGYLHRFWHNQQNMTMQTVRYAWDFSPLRAVREYDELLNVDMYEKLPTYVRKNNDFFAKVTKQKKIKFLNESNIECIHAMNNCLWRDDFNDALMCLDFLLNHNVRHLHIYLSGLKIALYLKKFDLLSELLSQIMDSVSDAVELRLIDFDDTVHFPYLP